MKNKPTPDRPDSARVRRITGPGLLLLCLASTVLLQCQPLTLEADRQPDTGAFQQPLTVANPGLNELSGLAGSTRRAAVLWALNDSGNASQLFAIDKHTGADLGQITVRGVVNIDWEDLAAFSLHGQHWLLIADVGDNDAVRQLVHLWLVPEPQPDADGHYSGSVQPAADLAYVYPAGPRDAESVAVDVSAGQIIVISKRDRLPGVYQLPLLLSTPDQVLTAELTTRITHLQQPNAADQALFGQYTPWISQPTGLTIRALPNGDQQALLLTYKQLYQYRKTVSTSWAETFSQPPLIVTMPYLRQAEAVSFDQQDDFFWLTSEQLPTPLYRLPLQD